MIAQTIPVQVLRAAFDPLTLSPALWLKSDAGLYQERSSPSTPAASDGDPVGTWQDQSGNARHVAAVADSNRPTLKLAIQNGRRVIRFDGTDDYLKAASSWTVVDHSIFAVLSCKMTGVNHGVFASGVDNKYAFNIRGTANHSAYYDGTNNPSLSVGLTADVFVILESNRTGTTWRTVKNGAQQGTDQTVLSNSIGVSYVSSRLLGDIFYRGDIGELLIFPSYLSAGNFTAVRNYLNARWAVY